MIEIRPYESRDLGHLVELHYSSGVLGLLGKLSPNLLQSFFYSPLLYAGQAKCFVAENTIDRRIVGVIVASDLRRPALISSFWTKFQVALRLISQAIKSPDILLRFLNYILASRFLSSYKVMSGGTEVELLLVDKSFQSSGVGSSLMDYFLTTCSRKSTVLVQTQNVSALDFYGKFGFRVVWKKSLLGVGLWICERKV